MIPGSKRASVSTMRCPRCNVDNPPGARFCSACGACSAPPARCGTALVAGQRFCTGCGTTRRHVPTAAGRRGRAPSRHRHVLRPLGLHGAQRGARSRRGRSAHGADQADAIAVIERHGGTVNQFVGDEVMALFGVPLARRDDRTARRRRRARAARARSMSSWRGSAPRRSPALSMHTGINTGLVVAAAAMRAPATTR